LRTHQKEFEEKGASVAAVGLGDRKHAQMFREDTGISFPLLIDEERKAYREARLRSANILHLLRPDNALARARAQAAGHRQTGIGPHPFQLGGSFIFAPGNQDIFTHFSQTFGDNATPEALLDAIPR
jgi:hypothetical protein